MRVARLAGAVVAALTLGLAPGTGALAQDVPSYAQPDAAQETIAGRIIAVDGPFHISLRDVRGFVDSVDLRANTVITPTGLVLAPGMDVTIVGSNGGASFIASEVDTQYAYDGDAPAPVYYGDGWYYPGFAYGYGPAFSLGFGFGSYLVPRPFVGRPWHGGGAPLAPGHGLRRPLATVPAGNVDTRRSFGAVAGPPVRVDQVSGVAQHRAEPVVYTVAPAPRAPAASRGPESSSRH
jgi:hypothetical protein